MTKSVVAMMKEMMKLTCERFCPGRTIEKTQSKNGEKAASPMTPPKSAAAFTSTWSAEKNCPG